MCILLQTLRFVKFAVCPDLTSIPQRPYNGFNAMNNTQEKITVLSPQKPILPKPVIILLVVAVIAIILLAGYFYLQKSFFKKEVLPSLTPTPTTNQNPSKPVPAPKAGDAPNPSPPQVQPIPVKGVQK